MSNEFVMVPREHVEEATKWLECHSPGSGSAESYAAQDLREALSNPAEQHQGEPVAWFTEDHLTDKSATTWDSMVAERWRAKGWPVSQLYTHADPGEVTMDQVLRAYEYAESHPHKYLRGTSNWCAAVAWHLNKNRSAQSGE